MTTTSTRPGPSVSLPVRVMQASAVASVLVLLFQFVTAGGLLPDEPSDSLVETHAAGALVLHVVAFAAVAAAFWAHRRAGIAFWPTVLAVVVFAAGFVQAYYGNRDTLWAHIPGAMILTVGTVWLMVWALRPSTHHRSARA